MEKKVVRVGFAAPGLRGSVHLLLLYVSVVLGLMYDLAGYFLVLGTPPNFSI